MRGKTWVLGHIIHTSLGAVHGILKLTSTSKTDSERPKTTQQKYTVLPPSQQQKYYDNTRGALFAAPGHCQQQPRYRTFLSLFLRRVPRLALAAAVAPVSSPPPSPPLTPPPPESPAAPPSPPLSPPSAPLSSPRDFFETVRRALTRRTCRARGDASSREHGLWCVLLGTNCAVCGWCLRHRCSMHNSCDDVTTVQAGRQEVPGGGRGSAVWRLVYPLSLSSSKPARGLVGRNNR